MREARWRGMTPAMRDPQETYDEARSYRLSHEPEVKQLPPGLTDEDLEELYYVAMEGRPAGLARLEKMVKRYPVVPSLWNYLAVGYRVRRRERKAREVERKLLERHPDYLFAKVAEARHRLQSGRAATVPEVLGESMTLREALGHDRPAHVSEWKHFYAMVAEWHMAEGRLEHAGRLLEAMKWEPYAEEVTEVLQQQLLASRLKDFQRRLAEDEKKRVQVDQGRVPKIRERRPKPALSPELEALYQHHLDLPESEVDAILALPRERAVAELRRVLRDAIDNGPHYFHFRDRYEDEEVDFGLHALWLLGEMKAEEALPEVLDFLGQHGEVLREVLGGTISWQPLVGFVGDDLAPLAEWMKQPGSSDTGRSALSEAVAVVAGHRPELRGEAVDFLRGAFGAMLEGEPGDGVLDTPLIAQMMGDVVALRAVELEDPLRELYAKGLVEEGFAGVLEDVLADLQRPTDPPRPMPGMLEHYRRLLQVPSEASGPDFDDDEDLFGPQDPIWPPRAGDAGAPRAEVGRNDPCPCGSGKKYKKCCLK